MTKKTLVKSRTNKVISGVCGGIGEYFNVDPSLIRIVWVIFAVFSAGFGGLLAYIICAIILPNPPYYSGPVDHYDQHNHNENRQQ